MLLQPVGVGIVWQAFFFSLALCFFDEYTTIGSFLSTNMNAFAFFCPRLLPAHKTWGTYSCRCNLPFWDIRDMPIESPDDSRARAL
ncbi:hypothetical protein IF1G_01993 [Cordyceps javanica]|uniref:Uncharacterized protein n=1 Tax=Cordyceps javanica TaxID=43265 RepID=A0A545VDJ5_9HYPO|nr:hypothetical protein IF1G_01993 [Cordyceps javanica]